MPTVHARRLNELLVEFYCEHFSIDNHIFQTLLNSSYFLPRYNVVQMFCGSLKRYEYNQLSSNLRTLCKTMNDVIAGCSIDADGVMFYVEIQMQTDAYQILQDRLKDFRLKPQCQD